MAALGHAGLRVQEIDLFAVASGPGSFTGLRIGIATIQGLAFVNSAPVVPVPALLALAHAGSLDLREGAIVGAWMDAHRRDVFSALYRIGRSPAFSIERLAEIEPPAVGDPATTWARWTAHHVTPAVIIGDGAAPYAHLVDPRVRIGDPPLLAPVIGRLAISAAVRGQAVDPATVHPVYVRRPDAEIDREKRAAQNNR
jgi:tRNA threonylcarbamoyladenosine biosynthesis protein TsaB